MNIPAKGKELGAIKTLYALEVDTPGEPGHHVTFADVQACFEAILLDPRWDLTFLSLHVVKDEIGFFMRDPVQFRLTKQRKRDAYNRWHHATTPRGNIHANYSTSQHQQSGIAANNADRLKRSPHEYAVESPGRRLLAGHSRWQ